MEHCTSTYRPHDHSFLRLHVLKARGINTGSVASPLKVPCTIPPRSHLRSRWSFFIGPAYLHTVSRTTSTRNTHHRIHNRPQTLTSYALYVRDRSQNLTNSPRLLPSQMDNLSINDPPPAPAKKFVKRDTLLENEVNVQKKWESEGVYEANADR